METKVVKYTEEELKNMKGSTNWASLVVKKIKTLTIKFIGRKKRAADFGVRAIHPS